MLFAGRVYDLVEINWVSPVLALSFFSFYAEFNVNPITLPFSLFMCLCWVEIVLQVPLLAYALHLFLFQYVYVSLFHILCDCNVSCKHGVPFKPIIIHYLFKNKYKLHFCFNERSFFILQTKFLFLKWEIISDLLFVCSIPGLAITRTNRYIRRSSRCTNLPSGLLSDQSILW